MSELKATTAQEIIRNEKDCDYMDELFGGVKMPPTQVYLKSEADEVISTIRAERDEYRYNLSCARNEIHNLSKSMKEDVKTIAELKADYKEACDRLQTANLIKDEQLAATRHHKFKQCLDKAELCELWYYRTKDLHRTKDIEDKYYMCSPLFKKRLFKLWLYEKWTNKWLELANKFKEGV